jgi:hypothetical protein
VRSLLCLSSLLCLAPLTASGNSAGGASNEPANPVACIQFWPEVQQRAHAYDHFVHLTSRCTTPARCEVSSDSNPAPVRVVVEPAHERRVLIAHGSPASTFVPHVACRFRPTAHPERPDASAR